MAIAGQGGYCITCDRQTMHVDGSKVNHILHFLIGFLTCATWWIVWLVIVIAHTERMICSQCGTEYRHREAMALWQDRHGGGAQS